MLASNSWQEVSTNLLIVFPRWSAPRGGRLLLHCGQSLWSGSELLALDAVCLLLMWSCSTHVLWSSKTHIILNNNNYYNYNNNDTLSHICWEYSIRCDFKTFMWQKNRKQNSWVRKKTKVIDMIEAGSGRGQDTSLEYGTVQCPHMKTLWIETV